MPLERLFHDSGIDVICVTESWFNKPFTDLLNDSRSHAKMNSIARSLVNLKPMKLLNTF